MVPAISELPGKGPLSGWILSHDQVEAVYMRRAGYKCRVLAEEGGAAHLPEHVEIVVAGGPVGAQRYFDAPGQQPRRGAGAAGQLEV